MNITTNKEEKIIYGKKDIMKIFGCESDKALRILKTMFQMGEANKIGKEYYVSSDALFTFLNDMRGREILI